MNTFEAGSEIVKISNLSFGYDKKQPPLLKALDLSVREGESIAILGPNGSGKTTLFKLILGLLTPWFGEVSIKGKRLASSRDRTFARRHIAYIPQERVVGKLPITVKDSILLGRYFVGYKGIKKPQKEDKKAVEEALSAVGLSSLSNRDVSKLSGGELQRMAIARGLVRNTPIMLLDEPVAHLDKDGKEEIPVLLRKIHYEEKLTMLTITHEEINMRYDRIFVFEHGSIKEITQ